VCLKDLSQEAVARILSHIKIPEYRPAEKVVTEGGRDGF